MHIKTFFKNITHKYWIAIIYISVLFLDRTDITITNIALPTIASYFKIPITQTNSIITSFLLALAISIPISAWLSDKFGVKKVFIVSTAIFGISSFLCAFASHFTLLILFRFCQGIGGGVLIPTGMTMLYRAFEPHEYAKATSLIFLPTLIAPALAPLLGGIITTYFGWPWIFLIATPICLLAIILSTLILKKEEILIPSPLDIPGFIYSSSALVLILYALSVLGETGFTLKINLLFVGIFFLIFLFIKQELKTSAPLFDLRFFKNKLFIQANLLQLMLQICHFGSIFWMGLYLQVGIGMSAISSGLVLGLQAIGAMCSIRYSVKLFNRHGATLPNLIGFTSIIVVTLSFFLIHSPHQIALAMIILFLRGASTGLCGTPIQTMSLISFNKADLNKVNAIFNAGRQLSISFGIALSSWLIGYGYRTHRVLQHKLLDIHTTHQVFSYSFLLILVACLLGIIISLRINNTQILDLSSRSSSQLPR